MSTIAERVAAGAAFLDEHSPGWDERIDLYLLDISKSCRCILGQLHGSFSAGLMAIGWPNHPDAYIDVRLGFMWRDDQHREDREQEADDLTAEWKRVITGRRAAS